jgi:hypothetical protein
MSRFLVEREAAVLNAVMTDPEMQALLQDLSARDAMIRAFIEDIIVAKLIDTFDVPLR